jgi:hypothetical protein
MKVSQMNRIVSNIVVGIFLLASSVASACDADVRILSFIGMTDISALVCSTGGSVYHANGTYAGSPGSSWYHSNGVYAGSKSASWYHSNGVYAGSDGASWYHSNGTYAGSKGASWYYANGTYAGTLF